MAEEIEGHRPPAPSGARDRIVATIDRGSEFVGRTVPWLLLVLVLIGAFNAIARYGGKFIGADLSSNLYLELQWTLFSAVFLLGGSYTLKRRGHVRVDVLYDRLSPRRRTLIDRLGTWLLLIPFCIFMLVISFDPVLHSIELREQSPDPGGIPRYLIKPLIPLGFALLLLQAIAEGLRRTDGSPAEETDEGSVPLG